MKIILTREESEHYFYCALCNIGNTLSGYGLKLDFNSEQYSQSRKRIKHDPCFEDVLMQMLKDGHSLSLLDIEGEDEYTRAITLKEVHARVKNTPSEHLIDMAAGRDDGSTADAILQTVFFNELVFA